MSSVNSIKHHIKMNKITIVLLIVCYLLDLSQATINICIPTHLDVEGDTPDHLLVKARNEIKSKALFFASESDDPTTLTNVNIDITHPAIDLYGTFDTLNIYNLFNFTICFLDNIETNGSSYKFDLLTVQLPNVTVNGIYNLTSGDLGDLFDLYGHGNYRFEISNVVLRATVSRLYVDSSHFCVPLSIDFKIDQIQANLENFLEDESLAGLMNGLIADIGPEAVSIIWEEIKEIYDKPIEDIINAIINYTSIDLLSLLTETRSSRKITPICTK